MRLDRFNHFALLRRRAIGATLALAFSLAAVVGAWGVNMPIDPLPVPLEHLQAEVGAELIRQQFPQLDVQVQKDQNFVILRGPRTLHRRAHSLLAEWDTSGLSMPVKEKFTGTRFSLALSRLAHDLNLKLQTNDAVQSDPTIVSVDFDVVPLRFLLRTLIEATSRPYHFDMPNVYTLRVT